MKKKTIFCAAIAILIAVIFVIWPPVIGSSQTKCDTCDSVAIEVPVIPIQPPNDSLEKTKRAEAQVEADRLADALSETQRKIKQLQRMRTAKPAKAELVSVVSAVKIQEKRDSSIEKPSFFDRIKPKIRISFGKDKGDCK